MRNVSTGLLVVSCLLATSWMACGSSDTTSSSEAATGANGSGGSNAGVTVTTGDGGGGAPSTSSGLGGGFATSVGGSSGAGVEGCNPENFVLEQAPTPEVYLVIDRSGSMNDSGASMNQSKWDELKGAVDAALSQFESQVKFGVLLYPTGNECATSGPQVAFADNNRAAIMGELNATMPAGGTPTAAALNNAATSLKSFGTKGSPRFLVLATDGGPNCNYFLDANNGCTCMHAASNFCCTNHPSSCFFGSSCLDDQGTLDVIKGLKANDSIDTFVIGLAGTDEYKGLLNEMAKEGGQPQVGGNTDYYAVTDQMSLLDALKKIAVSVISCKIELSAAPLYPDKVKIYVDGKEVPRDKTKMNGWDYTDSSNKTIELYGAACNTIQDGQEHKITATFDCDIF